MGGELSVEEGVSPGQGRSLCHGVPYRIQYIRFGAHIQSPFGTIETSRVEDWGIVLNWLFSGAISSDLHLLTADGTIQPEALPWLKAPPGRVKVVFALYHTQLCGITRD